jgi:hypothetical protein
MDINDSEFVKMREIVEDLVEYDAIQFGQLIAMFRFDENECAIKSESDAVKAAVLLAQELVDKHGWCIVRYTLDAQTKTYGPPLVAWDMPTEKILSEIAKLFSDNQIGWTDLGMLYSLYRSKNTRGESGH